jgi:predicted helicase
MMHENLGLIINRQIRMDRMQHFLVTNFPADFHILETANANAYLCPLYLYSDEQDMFSHEEAQEKKSNLNPKLVKSLTAAYGTELSPEEIFYYIYGVLYSNIYRNKYAEFLKIDFPRVPFTKDYELFSRIGKYGSELVKLHLMKSAELNNPIVKFQGGGDNQIEKPRYSEKDKRVYINNDQYFEGIEKEVWQYQIGGYQVLDKWLKDRKGRKLSLDDIKHYCEIATALKKTMEIQEEIDNLYLDVERETLDG